MPNSFPAPPAHFVGREEYISRFKSRLSHFRFFLYEGISGIGKTALLLRLAGEAQAVQMAGAAYISVHPGEAVTSILARLQCRLQGHGRPNIDQQGDPYGRLLELLHSRRLLLILDSLQNLRRDDLPALVRLFKAKTGDYRVIGGIRGDPTLSAMDRGQVHLERVGALPAANVLQLAQGHHFAGEALGLLEADAARGGAVGHPLTLHFVLALGAQNLPSKEFLSSQSARSVHAFKAFMTHLQGQLPQDRVALLGSLAKLGMPISEAVATQALGAGVGAAVRCGMLDVIDGDIYVHHLVCQYFSQGVPVQSPGAEIIAAHLQERASQFGEPLAAIRAAEVLAHAGQTETAVGVLAQAWEWARDPGFLEAYLKTLATVPAQGPMVSRLKLLAVQARMRQGNPLAVIGEIEKLAEDADIWTRTRALSSLAYIQSELNAHAKVVRAFTALQQLKADPETLLVTGILAAEAWVRTDHLQEGEALAQSLLKSLPKDQAAHHVSQEGELRRLLGRIDATTGRLPEAVAQVRQAVQCFIAAGDQYHEATSLGFIGDLYREAGEFEEAKAAFVEFLAAAMKWGDRDLIQIAELANAWVSLDIGDVSHAAKQVASVEKDMNAAPSARLKRYLAAAQALLEAGRGHHDRASVLLHRVVDDWEAAGQRTLAGSLQAQLVRSLIACDKLDEAQAIIEKALQGLDAKTSGPRMASLLRESALIHLRRGAAQRAMQELAQARSLFAEGGNRREEALTLHRIAHAALDEGNLELAQEKAKEALELASRIKHTRVRALSHELHGRLALLDGDADAAVVHARDAVQNLRRLGDELGTLHVSETLLRAYLFAGDLASALRLGPKVRDLAARLEVSEVRLRAVALSGVALLRRERLDIAQKCFRELPSKGVSPWTRGLMNRFGEALALTQGNQGEALRRRAQWVAALRQMPASRRLMAIHALEQLALAPRDRCELRASTGRRLLGTEELGLLDPTEYELFVDVLYRRIYDNGKLVKLPSQEVAKLLMRLVLAHPEPLSQAAVLSVLKREPQQDSKARLKELHKELQSALKDVPHVGVEASAAGLRLLPPARFAFLLPVWLTNPLTDSQKHICKLLRKLGSAPLQTILSELKLSKSAARRDMGELTKNNLVQAVREGRGQVYRLV